MGEEKERKKRKERNGQYQNQDFWTELNDKHIDEIDFTCTQVLANERANEAEEML